MKNIPVTWNLQANPKTLANHANGGNADSPTVRAIIDGTTAPHTYTVVPMPPNGSPGGCGTMVLVPTTDYYFGLVYVSGQEGSLVIDLPAVAGILIMDLPDGLNTTKAAITKAIKDDTGAGPPDRVGPP